jgi:hypothetical protein
MPTLKAYTTTSGVAESGPIYLTVPATSNQDVVIVAVATLPPMVADDSINFHGDALPQPTSETDPAANGRSYGMLVSDNPTLTPPSGSAASGTIEIAVPDDTAAGDFLVLGIHMFTNNTFLGPPSAPAAFVTPSGWTAVRDDSTDYFGVGEFLQIASFSRVAEPGDAGTTVTVTWTTPEDVVATVEAVEIVTVPAVSAVDTSGEYHNGGGGAITPTVDNAVTLNLVAGLTDPYWYLMTADALGTTVYGAASSQPQPAGGAVPFPSSEGGASEYYLIQQLALTPSGQVNDLFVYVGGYRSSGGNSYSAELTYPLNYGPTVAVCLVFSGVGNATPDGPYDSNIERGAGFYDATTRSYDLTFTDTIPGGYFPRGDLVVEFWANAGTDSTPPASETAGDVVTVSESDAAVITSLTVALAAGPSGGSFVHQATQGSSANHWVGFSLWLLSSTLPATRQKPRDDMLALGAPRQTGNGPGQASSVQNSYRVGTRGTYQ